MTHAYLTKRDIEIARILKQLTKQEIEELNKKLEICQKK